jgi:hypothetical protein
LIVKWSLNQLEKSGMTLLENRPVSRILVDAVRVKGVLLASPAEEVTADSSSWRRVRGRHHWQRQ